jgi:hypothetical protein
MKETFKIILNLTRKGIKKAVAEFKPIAKKVYDDTQLPQTVRTTANQVGTKITAIETQETAITNLKQNLKNAYATQRSNKTDLWSLLKVLKNKMETQTGFDGDKMSFYGFKVIKEGTGKAINEMPKVKNLSLSYGDRPGTIDAHWDAVHGFHYYHIQIAYTTPENWQDYKDAADVSSKTLSGLTEGEIVWVRVAVVGADNKTGQWSEPMSKRVP